MHHSPSGPPLSARLPAALSRWVRSLRRGLRPHVRLAPVVLVCGVAAAVGLTVPVLRPVTHSFADTAVGLDASSLSGQARAGGSERSEVATESAAPAAEPAPPSTAVEPAPPSTVAEPAPPSTAVAPSAAPAPAPEATTSSPAPETTEETTAPTSATAVPGTASAAAAPAAAADPGAEGQVLALVNQERAAAGCGAVAADEGLAALARAFSADMRDRGFFSHTDPEGLSPFDRGDRAGVTVLGENIAYGQPDAASVMTDWMNSPGHRANILNCSYRRLGVGVAYGPGGPWWTQDFS